MIEFSKAERTLNRPLYDNHMKIDYIHLKMNLSYIEMNTIYGTLDRICIKTSPMYIKSLKLT